MRWPAKRSGAATERRRQGTRKGARDRPPVPAHEGHVVAWDVSRCRRVPCDHCRLPPALGRDGLVHRTPRDHLQRTCAFVVWSCRLEGDVTASLYACYVNEQKRDQETCAPLTSFDWNDAEPNIIGTASIDTTCTIWDLNVRLLQQADDAWGWSWSSGFLVPVLVLTTHHLSTYLCGWTPNIGHHRPKAADHCARRRSVRHGVLERSASLWLCRWRRLAPHL